MDPYDFDPMDFQSDLWFGSMASFTQLRELDMPCENLLHLPEGSMDEAVYIKDSIPSSLEYLYIGNVPRPLFTLLILNINSVLTRRRENSEFQALKKVSLEFNIAPFISEESGLELEDPDEMVSLRNLLWAQMAGLEEQGIETEYL